jgi:large subunit ribosomal protein L4
MLTLDVVDLKNNKVGTVELPDAVFGVEVNQALLYQAVHHFQAGRRAGTHKTKVRGEVSGAGKKLWRQKGTGRARIGSIRSPLWRHGGTVHGPVPRDYSYRFPKKMLLGALRSALSARMADGRLKVVKAFDLAGHKTRAFSEILGQLDKRATVLLVDDGENRNLALSSRNLPGVTLMRGRDLHPYHLLRHEQVIFSQAAVEKCGEVLA